MADDFVAGRIYPRYYFSNQVNESEINELHQSMLSERSSLSSRNSSHSVWSLVNVSLYFPVPITDFHFIEDEKV